MYLSELVGGTATPLKKIRVKVGMIAILFPMNLESYDPVMFQENQPENVAGAKAHRTVAHHSCLTT